MNNEKLVSIITPCFNGEKFVAQYIESVLNQSYKNIELIIINDGSTDKTEEVILSYKEKFDKNKSNLVYLKQSANKGQSAAINMGLAVFTGEYMTWADSDDLLPPNAIKELVKYLELNPKVGIVKGQSEFVNYDSLEHVYYQIYKFPKNKLFFSLLECYAPGGYMVRTDMFKQAMQTPLVIESPREIGQNFQLLLPIAYHFEAAYILPICYIIRVREGSHSRVKHTYLERIKALEISDKVLSNIVFKFKVCELERNKLNRCLLRFHYKRLLAIMLESKVTDNLDEVKKDLICHNLYNKLSFRILFYRAKYSWFNFVVKNFYKVYGIHRRIMQIYYVLRYKTKF